MKRRIDPIAISSVGDYLKTQLDEYKSLKQKVLNDIESIRNVYKGADAELIINKYKERINNLDSIMLNYENYAIYTQKISGKYQENLNKAKKDINSSLENLDSNNSAFIDSESVFSSEILEGDNNFHEI